MDFYRMTERIYLYDSTLRDGAQTSGVNFSVRDKLDIAKQLDLLGMDYIEGGWPGANPTDDHFFSTPIQWRRSQLTAFGMTRRAHTSAANDPGLAALINTGTKAICVVGKAAKRHVVEALGISLDENIAMIAESIAYLKSKAIEPLFDAEHFFDGFQDDAAYSLACIEAAYQAGARWVVLCDTNGGSLPHCLGNIVNKIIPYIPGTHLGIHCHNDTENAVANSLAAVHAGVRHVQGTINGLGERCGNANLTALIPTLMLKMGFDVGINEENLPQLLTLSHFLDDKLNRASNPYAAYVGQSAFAHKGGLHASAVNKDPTLYEHIAPEKIGNERRVLVSTQAGRSNIIARLKALNIPFNEQDPRLQQLLDIIKEREHLGYAYEHADASFILLALRHLSAVPEFFQLHHFRVINERRHDAQGTMVNSTEATIKITLNHRQILSAAEGNGPVNALDKALRKALSRRYPLLKTVRLLDYKVRILNSNKGTEAATRVTIESSDQHGHRWSTVGVSANVIDASYQALVDSITYNLMYGEHDDISTSHPPHD
jgi:2-isopropylmalate synthase